MSSLVNPLGGSRGGSSPDGQSSRVRLNLAISLDGKISTADRKLHSFGGPEDRAFMEVLRAQTDVILIGGGTIRDEDPKMILIDPDRKAERVARGALPQPPVAVVTPSLELPDSNTSRFFHASSTPRTLLTRPGHDDCKLARYQSIAQVWEIPTDGPGLHLPSLLERLHQAGWYEILLEGGGQLNFTMLAAGLVDELYLTLCPLVFGGTTAPTAFGGIGFSATDVPGFELLDVRRGEDSRLFLHYQRAPREARRKAAL